MNRPSSRSGFTLIEVLVVLAIVGILLGLMFAAVQKMRDHAARAECQNHLKQMALALHSFHDQHKRMPPALSMSAADQWYLSWMGRILPYLEHENEARLAWGEYDRTYSPWGFFWLPAWGGKPPHEGLSQVVDLFKCPAEGRDLIGRNIDFGNGNTADAAFGDYLGVSGTDSASQDGMLVVGLPVKLSDVGDGTGVTLLIGERPPSRKLWYGWWYAGAGFEGRGGGDVILGSREVQYATALGCTTAKIGLQAGSLRDECDQTHFWSFHSGGANFAFADGSVRFLTYGVSTVVEALATRNRADAVSDF